MRTTQQFSITLPKELAKTVKQKVEAREYASESEVIREGLRALQARDRMIDHWLHTQAAAAFDALEAAPESAVSIEHVRARIAAEKAKRS